MKRSCFTCQKRRRGCDKARPTCQTCTKDGLQCLGYEQIQQPLFVNFNSANVCRQKRQVLKQAIRDRRNGNENEIAIDESNGQSDNCCIGSVSSDGKDRGEVALSDTNTAIERKNLCTTLTCTSTKPVDKFEFCLDCLNWTTNDFQIQCTVLWNHFDMSHSSSHDAWAPRFKLLANKNQALDLALIALSSSRLSQDTRNPETKLLSLTAYDIGLKVFRLFFEHVCSTINPCDPRLAEMALTSLVFSMFEAMQESPRTVFKSGWMTTNPHLRGALKLIQRGGPHLFQHGGYHLVFKKLREMAVLSAYCNYEATFLASADWMTIPWHCSVRSIRDCLYDIATDATRLVAVAMKPVTRREDDIAAVKGIHPWLRLYRSCCRKLDKWQQQWEAKLDPRNVSLVASLKGDMHDKRLELLHPSQDEADTIFLYLEVFTVKLMVRLSAAALHCKASFLSTQKEQVAAWWSDFSYDQLQDLAEMVKKTLALPVFRQNDPREAGIVEGQCRSLLAAWTLMEYERCLSQGMV